MNLYIIGRIFDYNGSKALEERLCSKAENESLTGNRCHAPIPSAAHLRLLYPLGAVVFEIVPEFVFISCRARIAC